MAIVLALLGFVSIAYGVAVMSLNSVTPFFAVWYALGAAWFAAAWATHAGVWANLPLVAKGAGAACLAAVCAIVIVTDGLMISQFDEQGEDGLDYVIVLGAQVRNTGPSVALASRLDAAYDYLMEYERTRCIVSGGQGPNEPIAEADAMYDYLVQRGIDPDRIIREDESLNTTQNIENSLGFLNPDTDRIGIVSNDYHVFRALAIARKHGMKNICGIAAGATPWYLPSNMTRESFGLAKDFLAGNL